jgi:CheY-like chemotaxis protein
MGNGATTDELPIVPVRRPADVLLVEDNFIIALDTEHILRTLGIANVRTARSVGQALDQIAAAPPEFALLDVNLGDEKCFEIASRLQALGVPFAFATGYGDDHSLLPAEFAHALIAAKPYSAEDLDRVVRLD